MCITIENRAGCVTADRPFFRLELRAGRANWLQELPGMIVHFGNER